MTTKDFSEEIRAIRREIRTWGKAPRDLDDRTPYQVAVVERGSHLWGWFFGTRPEPPSREEWRKTLPPRTLYEGEVRP